MNYYTGDKEKPSTQKVDISMPMDSPVKDTSGSYIEEIFQQISYIRETVEFIKNKSYSLSGIEEDEKKEGINGSRNASEEVISNLCSIRQELNSIYKNLERLI